jgi:hypothetical protein
MDTVEFLKRSIAATEAKLKRTPEGRACFQVADDTAKDKGCGPVGRLQSLNMTMAEFLTGAPVKSAFAVWQALAKCDNGRQVLDRTDKSLAGLEADADLAHAMAEYLIAHGQQIANSPSTLPRPVLTTAPAAIPAIPVMPGARTASPKPLFAGVVPLGDRTKSELSKMSETDLIRPPKDAPAMAHARHAQALHLTGRAREAALYMQRFRSEIEEAIEADQSL